MKQIISLVFLLAASVVWTGVVAQTSVVDKPDPQAKKILDRLKKEYDSYKSMEIDFELTMSFPGQDDEIQQGKVIQSGEKFYLTVDDRAIYNNGQYIWLHVKKNNEVQINDADMDEEVSMMSPQDMLQLYEDGSFYYAITDEPMLYGQKCSKIEFKPLDPESEFSKLSMHVSQSSGKVVQMKVFSPDGSRYTLRVNKITPNKKYGMETFTFNEAQFPGIHVEDLRID